MDPKVKPVINPPHKVSFALKKKLKQELQRMTQFDIIFPVNEPTDWVFSLIVVEKPNGILRLCLGPWNIYKAIKRKYYRQPSATDIFQEMVEALYFTKLDASNAFWEIKVDEESCKLHTFNSPCGSFRFLRFFIWDSPCQWGVSSSDHGIHRRMSECTGWHPHLGRYTWTAWKKNSWSSASCQTVRIKIESIQVSI